MIEILEKLFPISLLITKRTINLKIIVIIPFKDQEIRVNMISCIKNINVV